MNQKNDSQVCPCGSGKKFPKCCKPYLIILGIKPPASTIETILIEWLYRCSTPIFESFMQKVKAPVYRISLYLDEIVKRYFSLGFRGSTTNQEKVDNAVFYIKHNILLSIFASLSCLSQGLFLQSGVILRCLFEDCLVLVDLFENEGQVHKFLQNKYSTRNLLSRVKKFIPTDIVNWYGYFSANFAHFGPLHPAPYLPRACYPDNWVLVVGLQNIVRAVVAFHVVLERLYFDQTNHPFFWKHVVGKHDLVFYEDSKVFAWARKLGEEVTTKYPPNERKEGFFYEQQNYQTK